MKVFILVLTIWSVVFASELLSDEEEWKQFKVGTPTYKTKID